MSKKVIITCERIIEFRKECEVDDDEYELIKNLNKDDLDECFEEDLERYEVINKYIDTKDVYQEYSEFGNVTVTVVTKN